MMTIRDMAAALRLHEISAVELTEAAMRREAAHRPLNAFVTVTEEYARRRARELDGLLQNGIDLGPLHGIPIAHKDCLLTEGVRTTAGSRIFADYIPKRSADVVTRLEAAGAVMIGKTGLHEFTYGISGVNPHYGPVRNPSNADRVSGGSSSGSGAAVAAGIVPLATGTDTGGSIRIPASFCGCVGLKPTYGNVSRRGVMPLDPTQDHLGPMTNTVEDCATAYRVMAGMPPGALSQRDTVLHGLRIGIPKTYFWEHLDPEVEQPCRRAVMLAQQLGAEIHQVELPGILDLMQAARVSLLAEAAAILGRYRADASNVGKDVATLLQQGEAVTAVEYLDAQRLRRKASREWATAWKQVDCLITPTTPTTAFRIDETEMPFGGAMVDARQVTTRLTRPFNALGWPALSLPCGFTRAKMPVGLQLVAAANQEDTLFRVGWALEHSLC